MRSARASVVLLLAILLLTAAAAGQVPSPTGNLYGTALDEDTKFLPGVTVTLAGPGATHTAITDAKGDFRFLNLSPGDYAVTLERAGFATVRRDVTVALGGNAVLTATLPVAGAEEAVTVSGESPGLDSREMETGATFGRKELDTIPTTRDPWTILRQVPGVLVASMNVNGADSGIRSAFVGKGSHRLQNTYNLDGVAVEVSYFDFDSLQDIEVVTGGSDPALATPGVALNLVTRRGTNELKGSGRGYYFFPSSVDSTDQVPSQGGWDYGLEAGGPLWKDRLWLWGAYARNAVPGQTFFLPDGEPVRRTSHLEHWNAKLNAQPAPANSLTLFYLNFDKLVDGFGANNMNISQESTLNQTTPTQVYKIEDSHVLSEKLFASIYLSHSSGENILTPEGGSDKQYLFDVDYVARNSNFSYQRRFPQNQAGLTASGFFDTGDLQHELKFGFGYRHSSFDSMMSWPGDQLLGNEYYGQAVITRASKLKYEVNYYDAYLRDTIQTGNLTVNVGLRFDYQQGRNLPSAVSANPVYPDLLPAVEYSGDSGYPITWRLIQPRVGATYALGQDRKTLVRASYSRFANQLNEEIYLGNAFPGPAYLYYAWQDPNGNHHVDPDELDTCPDCLLYALNVDPRNPGLAASVNRISPNLEPPTTDEFIVGVEREIFSDLSASLAYTHRSSRNQEFFPFPIVGVTSADYQYFGNATGSVTDADGFTLSFDEPYYGLNTCPPPCSGVVLENRPDYSESYDGLELQIIKRLSHGWSLRASFGYNDWTKDVGPGAIVDPNNLEGGSNASGANAGDAFSGFGTVGTVWINSKWQFNVSGMVQLPLGINVAANFFGRQGFVRPYFVNVQTHDTIESIPSIQIDQVDSYRLPDVYQLDLHVEKLLRVGSLVTVTPSLDCFNAANSHTVLARDGRVGDWDNGAEEPFRPNDSFNAVSERLSDRTFRVGVRVSF